MKKSNLILKVIIVGLSIYFNPIANASCTSSGYTGKGIYFGDITVPFTLPIGGTIATKTETLDTTIANLNCTPSGGFVTYKQVSGVATGYSHVYATGYPGLGAILFDNDFGLYFESTPKQVTYPATYTAQNNSKRKFTVTLIKTGSIQSGAVEDVTLGQIQNQAGIRAISVALAGTTINVEDSCTVTTPSVNVPMVAITPTDLAGINTTAGETPFNIGLLCYPGAKISGSLSFTQNTDTADTSIISLTGAGSAGVAKGVGIQLLYGGSPLSNNTEVALKTSTGGPEFPANIFSTRYIQTQGAVLPGSANATATLNLKFN